MTRYSARRDPKIARKVMRLAKQGRSCREIAKAVGYSRTIVSQIAQDKGWKWGALNTEKATEARLAYSAERRALQELEGAKRLDDIFERMGGAHLVYAFTKDGDYVDHTIDKPDSKAMNELARAAYSLVATMKNLRNYEANADGDHSAVAEYLARAKGEPL